MTFSENALGLSSQVLTRIGLLAACAGILISGSALAAKEPQPDEVMASSCSATDVQAALDGVVVAGGMVVLPSGTCDWGSQSVSLDMNNKDVYLRGAGKSTGGTVIKRTSAVNETFALFFDCSNGSGAVEISDIAFEGNGQASGLDSGIKLNGSCRGFKIHDSSFNKYVMSGVETRGTDSRGVIYKNSFTDGYNPDSPDTGEGYGVVVYGTDSDPRPALTLGGPEAVFIEDNYFRQNRHSVASNQNSKYVVRHNEFITTNVTRDTSMIDAHGKSDDVTHGSRSWEVYENSLYFDGNAYWADGIQMRGGDGVVFNNTLGGSNTTGPTIAYVLRLVTSDGCPSGGQPPIYEQTTQAWIWGNTWLSGVAEPGPTVSTPGNCASYFRLGHEYFLNVPNDYVPYVYPHPLRGNVDLILQNGFE